MRLILRKYDARLWITLAAAGLLACGGLAVLIAAVLN
jgi:hypothetical protein